VATSLHSSIDARGAVASAKPVGLPISDEEWLAVQNGQSDDAGFGSTILRTMTMVSDAALNLVSSVNQIVILLIAALLCVILSIPAPRPEGDSSISLFRTGAVRITHTPYSDRWMNARKPMPAGRRAVLASLNSGGGKLAQISNVQKTANKLLRYADDIRTYGRPDYWASPAESLALGAGDCEDSAILKMAMLAALGIPEDKMFLTVGNDLVSRNAHVVLTVDVDGELYVLDQLADDLVKMANYRDFKPIMTLSGNRSWLHGEKI